MYVAKTKALISFAGYHEADLRLCFRIYAKFRFSHYAAHICVSFDAVFLVIVYHVLFIYFCMLRIISSVQLAEGQPSSKELHTRFTVLSLCCLYNFSYFQF